MKTRLFKAEYPPWNTHPWVVRLAGGDPYTAWHFFATFTEALEFAVNA